MSSSLLWTAFFDILLCSLDHAKQEETFYIKTTNDELLPVRNVAFCDDLITPSATLYGLQFKALIISAFVVIFGLEIVKSKLRTVHYTNNKKQNQTDEYITIYKGNAWQSEQVPVSKTQQYNT